MGKIDDLIIILYNLTIMFCQETQKISNFLLTENYKSENYEEGTVLNMKNV